MAFKVENLGKPFPLLGIGVLLLHATQVPMVGALLSSVAVIGGISIGAILVIAAIVRDLM